MTSKTETGPYLGKSNDSGYSGSLKHEGQSHASCWKPEDIDSILRHFRFLKDEVYVKPLVDRFFQNGDFDKDDMEEICGQRSRRQTVDLFLRKLLRLNGDSFCRFLDYLEETEQKHIADTLKQAHVVMEDLPAINQSDFEMETRVLMNLDRLCDDLEPDKIADHFLLYRVFNIDEYESIISHRTRRKKAEEMIGLILENLPKSFLVLKLIYKKIGKDKMLEYSPTDVCSSENQCEIISTIREKFEMKRRDIHCTCHLYPAGYYNTKMRLHVDHQESSDVENKIVECLQNKIEEINEELKKMTNCKVVLVKYGSIVIHLLNCGPLLRKKKHLCEDVDKLLNVVFKHIKVASFECSNGFRVTLDIPAQKSMKKQRITGETLERNRDYIIEELSAVPFLRHKKISKVFEASEIDSVLNGTTTNRESKMNALLSIILKKGDPALRFFEMVLKEENQTYIIKRLCQSDMDLDTSPTGSYVALIDEMSPSLFADECKAISLDVTGIVKEEYTPSRIQLCEKILEYALCQDHKTKQKFLWVFGNNYPDQVDFGVTTRIKMSSRCNSYNLLESVKDRFTEIYNGKHVIQIEIQPKYLTTRQSSFGEIQYEDKGQDQHKKGPELDTHLIQLECLDISRSLRSDASSGYCTDGENIYPNQNQSQDENQT